MLRANFFEAGGLGSGADAEGVGGWVLGTGTGSGVLAGRGLSTGNHTGVY